MAYFVSGRRQAVSTILGWPASPSLPNAKTLVFGATTHFVSHSKIGNRIPLFTDVTLLKGTSKNTQVR